MWCYLGSAGAAILALTFPERVSVEGLKASENQPEGLPGDDCGAGPEDIFDKIGVIS